MTRMGLRNFICLLPVEAADHDHQEWAAEEEMEQPGTSYSSREDFSCAENRKGKATAAGAPEFEPHRSRDRVNCSSGGAQMLACFRAGAINLIVHPAMASMGAQRQGASTVQPVNSLPRAAFLDGAADHDSGDDPTSPVVTCIGQVRKERPNKTPPKNPEVADPRTLKPKRGKPQQRALESASAPSSPRPSSKWKQILGARGTVNPSHQQTRTEIEREFHIDLNRFSSTCSSIATGGATGASTPDREKHQGRINFFAKSLKMMQQECDPRDASDSGASKDESGLKPCVQTAQCRSGASEEVLLWQRRSGACKPLSLDLKRRAPVVLPSDVT